MIGGTRREPAWLCVACGYMMDAVSHMTKDVGPKDGDLCICLNCAEPYVRHGDRWQQATAAELRALSREESRELFRHIRAQRAVIDRDLARGRGGRA